MRIKHRVGTAKHRNAPYRYRKAPYRHRTDTVKAPYAEPSACLRPLDAAWEAAVISEAQSARGRARANVRRQVSSLCSCRCLTAHLCLTTTTTTTTTTLPFREPRLAVSVPQTLKATSPLTAAAAAPTGAVARFGAVAKGTLPWARGRFFLGARVVVLHWCVISRHMKMSRRPRGG